MNQKSSFFILSCARTGSTSLAKILNTSTNSLCQSEPSPNLNREMRLAIEGKLSCEEIDRILEESVVARSREFLEKYEVYGEKNVTYAPFITKIYEKLGCKFVFIKRDGRDVVTSLMNWHGHKFGTVYREARDNGILSNEIIQVAKNLLSYQDSSDFSRPRPLNDNPLYYEWMNLSRFEMCSYYWSYINDLYLSELSKIAKDAYIELDYTNITAEKVIEVGEFLGLQGLELENIKMMLDQKINSLEDRGHSQGMFPKWNEWNSLQREQFDKFASNTMYTLGYYTDEISKWKPKTFGMYWRDKRGADNNWFTWMHKARKYAHDDLIRFVQELNTEIESIADFGCGTAVGYADAFKDKVFVGVDISENNIKWCKENRKNPKHDYICQDFIQKPLSKRVDLVFSSGTIDNSYDVKAYIKSMIDSSNKYISFTLYRGWFPNLETIEYHYNPDGYFYNDIGVSTIKRYLEELGCIDFSIVPLETLNDEILYETRVIAKVSTGEKDER